ncbi:unnamed protein product [Effrenium voratum]|nr:unnamed protein product [Effrenium voratum]
MAFVGLDADAFQPEADAVAELQLLKQGLDFRSRELQEGRKRLRQTQRRLQTACEEFKAERAGLHAELRSLGQSGQQLGESLHSQKAAACNDRAVFDLSISVQCLALLRFS